MTATLPALSCVESRRADHELGAELLRQTAFQPDDGLIAHLVVVRQEAVSFAQVVLWQALHADKEAALPVGTARPAVNQPIDGLPPAKVEVAYAEIRTLGDLQGFPQRRQQFEFDIVENAWHRKTGRRAFPPFC